MYHDIEKLHIHKQQINYQFYDYSIPRASLWLPATLRQNEIPIIDNVVYYILEELLEYWVEISQRNASKGEQKFPESCPLHSLQRIMSESD